MRPGIASQFGCAMPDDPALEGDRVEPAVVCSVRSLRRIGPDKEVNFGLVAEIVQRRWVTRPAGQNCEFYGGSTIIIGPDGQIRYIINKSITNAQRVAAQVRYLDSGASGKSWDVRNGRRFIPPMALRELHACVPAKRAHGP